MPGSTIIIGASSGIGEATAYRLAATGQSLILLARRYDRLESLQAAILKQHSQISVTIYKQDITHRESLEMLCESLSDRVINAVVLCAGAMYFSDFETGNLDELAHMIDVNCTGLLHVLHYFFPLLKNQDHSQFIIISSDAGKKVFPGLAVYSATKFFVEKLVEGFRQACVAHNIKVCCIQPGNVLTDLPNHSTDRTTYQTHASYDNRCLKPMDIAKSIEWVIAQDCDVAINELLIEPKHQPL